MEGESFGVQAAGFTTDNERGHDLEPGGMRSVPIFGPMCRIGGSVPQCTAAPLGQVVQEPGREPSGRHSKKQ